MKRDKCIVCSNHLRIDSVIIGNQYPSAVFVDENEDNRQFLKTSSLNIAKCSNSSCGLVQLSSHYNLDMVFNNYPYVSSTTATMKSILKDVVDEGVKVANPGKNDVVLDIGGNDGTMMSYLNTNVAYKINMDAAHGIESVPVSGNYKKIVGLFSSDAYNRFELSRPKLIFCVAMFYHLDNPREFCDEVASIMSNESVWVIQMTYLKTMLEDNIYDNVVHEHNAYYSMHSLEYLLKLSDLHICGARIVESYGGSMRVYVKKRPERIVFNDLYNEYVRIKELENKTEINTNKALELFNERIKLLKQCSYNLIQHIIESQGKIVALGASTKGNMICQFVGIGSDHIKCVLDNNIKKIGKVMTGSNIPVVDEKEWLNRLPKYLLVLPYYYVEHFVKMVSSNTKKGKITFIIVLLPVPKLIKVRGKNNE
jgi:NDP-4-keto-2,6-dideoxyhexose 3-C-methyltransferase